MIDYKQKHRSVYLSLNPSQQGAASLDEAITRALADLATTSKTPHPKAISLTSAGSDRYFLTVIID